MTAKDSRCSLVSPDAYTAAGGRTETDLFGERAPALLDPAILTDLWTARVGTLAEVFEAEGLRVHVTAGGDVDLPEGLEPPGYIYGGRLPTAEMAAYREAEAVRDAAAETVSAAIAAGADDREVDLGLVALVRAELVVDQIALGGRAATCLVFTPAGRTGIQVQSWAPVEAEVEDEASDAPHAADADAGPPPFVAPRAVAPEPDIKGIGHSLHALRTDVATRGLIRALADEPRTALTALIARLFQIVARSGYRARPDSVLTLSGDAFIPRGGRVIPALDGVVHDRIDARRADWEASGLTLVRWVHGLGDEDRLVFLAELTALTVDLREARTSLIRHASRAEASELAILSDAQITRYWTPDADFLTAHSKVLLQTMLEDMGKAVPGGASLGKPELVDLVETTAAARNWAPAALSWAADETDTGAGEGTGQDGRCASAADEDAPTEGEELDGCMGAFEVTDEGRAALAHVAE